MCEYNTGPAQPPAGSAAEAVCPITKEDGMQSTAHCACHRSSFLHGQSLRRRVHVLMASRRRLRFIAKDTCQSICVSVAESPCF